ncbi:MAG: hypothetical protein IKZ25_04400 [Clostridia bacterium]|nr:hypothetical protein [Clostridia bacterium]
MNCFGDKEKICCFFGHRKVENPINVKEILCGKIEDLIIRDGVRIFLFGSKSEFDDLCYETVTKLKEKYSFIQRIYIATEVDSEIGDYKKYLLKLYDKVYLPKGIFRAGKSVYIQRNRNMIENSGICLFYYNENYSPKSEKGFEKKSGTKIAYKYAKSKGKKIINIFEK